MIKKRILAVVIGIILGGVIISNALAIIFFGELSRVLSGGSPFWVVFVVIYDIASLILVIVCVNFGFIKGED